MIADSTAPVALAVRRDFAVFVRPRVWLALHTPWWMCIASAQSAST